ncbi:MAG: hypothetical protein Q8830_03865, partial [Candidatus Phytoplasma australasiaticum]|nr:hypothetical protein [Candidatus Phytoplasma australasiaticum]
LMENIKSKLKSLLFINIKGFSRLVLTRILCIEIITKFGTKVAILKNLGSKHHYWKVWGPKWTFQDLSYLVLENIFGNTLSKCWISIGPSG